MRSESVFFATRVFAEWILQHHSIDKKRIDRRLIQQVLNRDAASDSVARLSALNTVQLRSKPISSRDIKNPINKTKNQNKLKISQIENNLLLIHKMPKGRRRDSSDGESDSVSSSDASFDSCNDDSFEAEEEASFEVQVKAKPVKASGASNAKPASTKTAQSASTSSNSNKKSIEQIYQKKTQLEHILLRPDTYIGSTESLKQAMWVWDTQSQSMVHREITYVPGFYKIFDEILVNAADNKIRDPSMDCLKVHIDKENNLISVYNNGRGIPVQVHQKEKVYVPELIFGHLLTSSNYDDDERKVTGGRNGYGAKLCNIFSKKFVVETAERETGKKFRQVCVLDSLIC